MVTFGLKYEVIKWNLERVSNIKSFTNKYKWKIINYQDQVIGKSMGKIIAFIILYIKGKEICPAYISKINSNCEKKKFS